MQVILNILALYSLYPTSQTVSRTAYRFFQDGVDRDAALLAATFAEREDVMEDVEVADTRHALLVYMEIVNPLYRISQVMEDDSDEADDIPTIKVGGEEYEITDVTHEIIAK